jgi:probable rRNA maturation factor
MVSVTVHVASPYVSQVDAPRVQLVAREAVSRASDRLSSARPRCTLDGSIELAVLIAGDERIRELNRTYRGADLPTDVLAFGGEAEGFVEASEAAAHLGDVAISYPRVQSQAEEHGHSEIEELALLVVHGVLHLLGYDHATPEEEAEMWSLQDAILSGLSLS